MSFWQTLPRPIVGMAPMDGVTDVAFRSILAAHGKPSVLYTEFVHVMALWYGRINVYNSLRFESTEQPIIAQIFGTEPEYFYKAAHIICELGYDGIDINMGCPANTIVRRGGGAQLIGTPKLAQQIIKEVKRGVLDWLDGQTLEQLGLSKEKIKYIKNNSKSQINSAKIKIPVSVKTRLGLDQNTISEWIGFLIDAQPEAITVHGRTLKQLYSGKADWDAIGSMSGNVHSAGISYLGNGDVQSYEDAVLKCNTYGLDGVLIGRAALGNPWVFNCASESINPEKRLSTLLEHARLHDTYYDEKQFPALKKHLGWYCTNFEGARQLRVILMNCKNYFEIENAVLNFGYGELTAERCAV